LTTCGLALQTGPG